MRAAGHHAEVRDFLDSGPLRIGAALRSGYEFELKHLPSAYEATYRMWYRVPWLCPLVAWLVTALTHRRVLRWVRESGAAVVVSTYPLATLCLGGCDRPGGSPSRPSTSSPISASIPCGSTGASTSTWPCTTGPPRWRPGAPVSRPWRADRSSRRPSTPASLPDRGRVRTELGLAPSDRAVLVVAGSWGVGGVEATWRALTSDGRYTPVVVCGRDERLRQAVTALAETAPGNSVVLGWTDAMPALMAGCDALVENAGGLTSLEAMRAGLPVVSFKPIAGHGRENTARMAAAGVSRLAADPGELIDALAAVTTPGPARSVQIKTGQAMFRGSADRLALEAATAVSPTTMRRRPAAYVGRAAAAVVALAGLGWTGLTSGVEVAAAAAGAGVAHAPAGANTVAFVGVRLNAAELANPSVAADLQRLHLTAVVDQATALTDPQAARALAARGVTVASGGRGDSTRAGHDGDPMLWTRARGDARAGLDLQQLLGAPVTVLVPGRRVNAWDLIECSDTHSSLVVPDHVVNVVRAATDATPLHLTARHIYLINGLEATPAQLGAVLARLGAGLALAHLTAGSFDTLA